MVFAPVLHPPMLGLVSAGHSIRVAFVFREPMNTMEMLAGKGCNLVLVQVGTKLDRRQTP